MATVDVSRLSYVSTTPGFSAFAVQWIDKVKALVPSNSSEGSNRKKISAELNSISFRAHPREITAIVTEDASERRTIAQLVAKRRNFGYFDGQVFVSGIDADDVRWTAFVSREAKKLYTPGLTYEDVLTYAARLRLPNVGFRPGATPEVKKRVEEVMQLMDLTWCRSRVIQDSPPDRGPVGGELRRLSIAVEIITLPSIVVLDDPTRGLEPAVAAHLFERLRILADKGCTVITSIPTPLPSMLDLIDRIVVVSNGYSLFSAKKENIVPYFTSPEVGFKNPGSGHVIDFIFKIARGESSLSTKGVPFDAAQLHNTFANSPFNENKDPLAGAIELLPDTHEKYYGYFKSDSSMTVLSRVVVVVERAFVTKFKESEVIKKGWASNIIIALLIGYFGFKTGDFGDYAKGLLLPYNEALNCASLLFIVSAFLVVQQVSNVHTICQKLRVYRYEQKANCSPMIGMWLGTLASEYFSGMFFSLVFSTILYFMTALNEVNKMGFFIRVVLEMTLVGVTVATALAGIFRTEIVVRDVFLLYLFAMIMLSAFPFQLTSMTDEASRFSAVNPLRWCYEALMKWKFEDYEDGESFLTPYGFENFDKYNVFYILFNFIIFNSLIFLMTLTPPPNSLERKPKELRINYFKKDDDGSLLGSGKVNSSTTVSLIGKEVGSSSSSSSDADSAEANKVAAFERSASGRPDTIVEGPKVYFEELAYIVKDRKSPLGHKSVLVEATGEFEAGKISVVMGACGSGKSVLLHMLAGNAPAFNARQFGRVLVDGKHYEKSHKPWQRSAYVDAVDYQYRDITVHEVLRYAALLRCREVADLLVAENNLNDTLDVMQLRDVQNKMTKNISKGALRRLSIGEEIIHGIPLVIVDEPVNGTDADSSIVMSCLRRLANRKNTIIMSAYQPAAPDFQQFDHLYLLSKGRVVYNGPAAEAFAFFKNMDKPSFDLSRYYNPADFFADLSLCTVAMKDNTVLDSIVLEKLYKKTPYYRAALTLKSSYGDAPGNPLTKMDIEGPDAGYRKSEVDRNSVHDYDTKTISSGFSFSSFRPQFYLLGLISTIYQNAIQVATIKPSMLLSRVRILLVRSTLVLCKRYKLMIASFALHILLALVFSYIVGDSSEDLSPVLSFYGVGALLLIILNIQFAFFIYKGNEVFMKENSRGLYSCLLYWLFGSIPYLFYRFILGILYACISAAALDLDDDTMGFFVGITIMLAVTAAGLGETLICLAPSLRDVYALIPAIAFIFFFFSGLILKPNTLPEWTQPWVPSISIIRWAMQGMTLNRFYDYFPPPNQLGFDIYAAFLSSLGWGGKTKYECLNIVGLNMAIYRILSYIALVARSIGQVGRRMLVKRVDTEEERIL